MRIAAVGTALTLVLAVATSGCDSVLDALPSHEGIRFSYSGAASGRFESAGTVTSADDALPALAAFAMAQHDSIGGLLLGSFRKTAPAHGDLFILQIRGTEPGTYTCGEPAEEGSCYGHLYVGVEANGRSLSAEEIFAISTGEVTLEGVDSQVAGAFELTLRPRADNGGAVTVADGTLHVPVVEGVFASSFSCLLTRLQEGAGAGCD